MIDRLFQLLASDWLISRDSAISYLPAFIAFLNGAKFDLTSQEDKKPSILTFDSFGRPQPINTAQVWELCDNSIPENSIAMIPIQGVIRSWSTMQLINDIKTAEANPQINSIVLLVSSPGGMTSQLDIAARTIKNSTLPSVAVIFEMAASAAMWLTSAMSYRIATSPMDMVGSIGTKTSFTDISGLLKDKLGITITDIYATKSTNKEAEIRALLANGDTGPIVERLDFVNDYFHSQIQANLGISADSEVFSGSLYFAQKAQDLGLINEINTVEYALEYAYNVGLKYKLLNFSKSLNR